MKKNKGLFGGVLELGGKVMLGPIKLVGKGVDTALSITDKISRGLFGDKITDAVEKPFDMAKDAGKITAGRIQELPEKLEQEAAKYEKVSDKGNKDIASKGMPIKGDYLPDDPVSKGFNGPLTNDIGNLINSKTAGSSALAGPAGNLAQDIDLNK